MRVPDKGNPSEALNLAGDASEGFDELGKLPSRVERYGRARKRAKVILAHLRGLAGHEFEREFYRLARCGNWLQFRQYPTVGKVRLHRAKFCAQPLLCPLCAIRRGSKILGAYVAKYQALAAAHADWRAYLVTLTVKNGGDLAERFEHLRRAVESMSHARRRARAGSRDLSVFNGFEAVMGSFEVTNIGNGWHPHVHMIVLAPVRPSAGDLRAEWRRRTGDSFVVDVEALGGADGESSGVQASDFFEVCKYAVKFSSLAPADCVHAYSVLRRRRLLFTLGAFRGVVVPKAMTDEPLDGLPYVDLFYRYLDGVGYSVERVTGIQQPTKQEGAEGPE